VRSQLVNEIWTAFIKRCQWNKCFTPEVTPFLDFDFGDCAVGCFGVTSGYS
jgi:hypothetical protein